MKQCFSVNLLRNMRFSFTFTLTKTIFDPIPPTKTIFDPSYMNFSQQETFMFAFTHFLRKMVLRCTILLQKYSTPKLQRAHCEPFSDESLDKLFPNCPRKTNRVTGSTFEILGMLLLRMSLIDCKNPTWRPVLRLAKEF